VSPVLLDNTHTTIYRALTVQLENTQRVGRIPANLVVLERSAKVKRLPALFARLGNMQDTQTINANRARKVLIL
jgi:hypothetical protein